MDYIPNVVGGNSPRRPRFSNIWTESEQNEKLQGYIEIAPELWSSIKCNSHIRYITIDNIFKTGGLVLKNPTTIKPNFENKIVPSVIKSTEEGQVGIRLHSSFNRKDPNYITWFVSYESIKKMYLKVDASIRTVVKSLEITIESVNNNMKKITEYVRKLDERVKKLESINKESL
jgi:hypothetical protein